MSIFSDIKTKLSKALVATTIIGGVASTPALAEEEKTGVSFDGNVATKVLSETIFMPSDSGIDSKRVTSEVLSGSMQLSMHDINTKIFGKFAVGQESGLYNNPYVEGAQGHFRDSNESFTDVSIGAEFQANRVVAFNASATAAHQYVPQLSMAALSGSDHMRPLQEDIDDVVVYKAGASSVGVNARGVNIFASQISGESFNYGVDDERVHAGIFLSEKDRNGDGVIAGVTFTKTEVGQIDKERHTIFAHYRNEIGYSSEIAMGVEYLHNFTDLDNIEDESEGFSAYLRGKTNLGTNTVPVNLSGSIQGRSTKSATEIDGKVNPLRDGIERDRWVASVGIDTGYVKGNFSAIVGAGYAFTKTNERSDTLSYNQTKDEYEYVDYQEHDAGGGYAFAKLNYKF